MCCGENAWYESECPVAVSLGFLCRSIKKVCRGSLLILVYQQMVIFLSTATQLLVHLIRELR